MRSIATLFLICCCLGLGWGQVTIYSEDFTGQNGKGAVGPTPTTDLSGVTWDIDISDATLSASDDWFQVVSEVFEGRDLDGPAIWTSPIVDISSYSNIMFSLEASEDGDHEGGDIFLTEYRLDGTGSWIQASTSGSLNNNFTTKVVSQAGLSGNSIEIRVTMDNDAGNEFMRLDNILIESEPTVGWNSPTSTENETNATQTINIPVTATDITASNVSFDVSVTGGSAESGDYTLNTSSLSFTGNGTQNVSIDINDDADTDDETIELTLTESTSTGVTISPAVHTITVFDDELASIIITEIMQNPSAVSDSDGEYFEVYNAGSSTVDMDGWTISDNGGSSHTISNGGPLNIGAGQYLVFARNANTSTNGGFTADYEYSGIDLVNAGDEIILTNASAIEIDRVEYDGGPSFPDPTGASMFLTNIGADNNVGSNWAESTSASGLTGGDLGSPGAAPPPLPITLQNFTATPKANTTHLHWRTATELNNDYMAVEHSTDGRRYSEIGRVLGGGTTQEPQDYRFTHEAPARGLNYYRLRQVDYDGQYEYHGPVTARFGNGAGVLDVFPTATADELTVSYEGQLGTGATLSIQSTSGRTLREWAWDSKSGRRTAFSVADLPAGWYVLRLRSGREVVAGRFLKQ